MMIGGQWQEYSDDRFQKLRSSRKGRGVEGKSKMNGNWNVTSAIKKKVP